MGRGGVRREGRTSDSPADQRRSMSVNVRGAARTRRDVDRVRRVRVVGRKCISMVVGLGRGWVVVVVFAASCLWKRKNSRRDNPFETMIASEVKSCLQSE